MSQTTLCRNFGGEERAGEGYFWRGCISGTLWYFCWKWNYISYAFLRCLEYMCRYTSALNGINERDHEYHTPLHIAVMNNLPANTKCLLMAKVCYI